MPDYVGEFRAEFLNDSPREFSPEMCVGARQAAKWVLRVMRRQENPWLRYATLCSALNAILAAIPDVNDEDVEFRSERT